MEKFQGMSHQHQLAKRLGPGLAAQVQAAQIYRALGGVKEEQEQGL